MYEKMSWDMRGRERRDHVCRMRVCLLWAGDNFEWARPTSAEAMETSKVANSKQAFMAILLGNGIAMSKQLLCQSHDHRGGMQWVCAWWPCL